MQELPQTGGPCGNLSYLRHQLVFCILLTRIVSIDLLWSDPEGQVETWAVSPRGGGYLFGSMPTNAVSIFTI